MRTILIRQKIYEIRGVHVMLDSDLAVLYEMETKVLKQAVRRNINRFPPEFMFELNKEETDSLRSQIVTLEPGRGKYSKYLPFAFTEHGVAMLASVLNSEKAIAINIAIVKAFIALREMALGMKKLSDKIAAIEEQYNKQFADVFEALNFLIGEKRKEVEQKNRVRIGFKK
jgi:phage regulator Rha-like protein